MTTRLRPRGRMTLLTSMPALAVLGLGVQTAPHAQTIEEKVKVAPGLYQIVYSPSTNTVYVASVGERGADNAQIVELDGDTLERKDTIELSVPLYGLGLNEKTQTLYGTDTRAGNVVAIDLETDDVIATIGNSDGAHVRETVVDEDANLVYISVVGRGDGAADEVWVIDGETNSLSHKIAVDTEQMTGIALDAEGNRVFGTGMGANEIAVVDLEKREVVERWPAGGERPTNAAYDAASGRLFVTNQGTGTLTVLDADDGSLIESIETGAGALSVAFDEDDNRIYVSNRQAGTVSVVDGASYEVVAQLETGTLPQTIAIDYAGDRVYVSNKAQGLGRNAPPDAVPPVDPNGDTVVLIRQ
jgi:YVTN family beta-propeller protein